MSDFILSPVIALFIYFVVVSIATRRARLLAAHGHDTDFKSATYASGEANDPMPVAYGYSRFFVVALFFAILHLGVLMIGSSGLSLVAIPYLLGLILVLVALMLG